MSGVTSAIQTQLNNKLNLTGGTITGDLNIVGDVSMAGDLVLQSGLLNVKSLNAERTDYRFPPVAMTANTQMVSGTGYGEGEWKVSAANGLSNTYLIFNRDDNINDGFTTIGSATTPLTRWQEHPISNTDATDKETINSFVGVSILISSSIRFNINQYSLYSRTNVASNAQTYIQPPTRWVLFGSNDETTWDIVDNRTDKAYTIPNWVIGTEYTTANKFNVINENSLIGGIFNTSNNNKYKYHKILFTHYIQTYDIAVNTVIIREIELYGTPENVSSVRVNDNDTNVSITPYEGNVGIGTMTPQAKLDVHGDVMIEEYSLKNAGTDIVYPQGAYVDVVAGTKYTADNEFSVVVLKNGDVLKIGKGTQIWRSSDNGNTWVQLPNAQFTYETGQKHSVVMNNGDVVTMVSGTNAVYKSTNGGQSWSLVCSNADLPMVNKTRRRFVLEKMPNDELLFMGGVVGTTTYLNDVWISRDGGATWSVQTNSAPWVGRTQFNSYVIDNEVYIVGGFSGTDPRRNDIWKSADLGATWEVVWNVAPFGGRSSQNITVTKQGNVLLGGGGSAGIVSPDYRVGGGYYDLWISRNKGYSWENIHSTLEGMIGTVYSLGSFNTLPNGSILLTTGSTTVLTNRTFRSDDEGRSWYELTSNNAIIPTGSKFGAPAIQRLNDGTLIMLTNTSQILVSSDNGNNWSLRATLTSVGHSSLIRQSNDVLYIIGHSSNRNQVLRSTDKGMTWTETTNYPVSNAYNGIGVVFSDDTLAYFGGFTGSGSTYANNAYLSTNNGTSWTLNGVLPVANSASDMSIVRLSDDSLVYVRSKISYRSIDKGATWVIINNNIFSDTDLSSINVNITTMTVTKNDTIILYNGFFSDHETNSRHVVMASYDKGFTFVPIKNDNSKKSTENAVIVALDNEIVVVGGNIRNVVRLRDVIRIPMLAIEQFRTIGRSTPAYELNAVVLRENGIALEDKYLQKQGRNVINGELLLEGGDVRLERPVEPVVMSKFDYQNTELTMSEPELRYPPDLAGAVLDSNGSALVGTTGLSVDINAPTLVRVSGQPYGNGVYGFLSGNANTGSGRNLFNAMSSTLTDVYQSGGTSSGFNPFNDTLANGIGGIFGIVYPRQVKINKFNIQSITNFATRWVDNVIVRASNTPDYSTFTTLGTVDTSGTNLANTLLTYTFTNSNYYRYYFFTFNHNISGISGISGMDTSVFHPFGTADTLGLQYPPQRLTADIQTISTARYGNGVYDVSASSTFNSTSIAHKLFNYNVLGNGDGNDSWYSGVLTYQTNGLYTNTNSNKSLNGVSGEFVRLSLPQDVLIQSYRLVSMRNGDISNNLAPSSWTLMGSNDNINWTNLDSRVDQPYPSQILPTTTSIGPWGTPVFSTNNNNYYRHYAIVISKAVPQNASNNTQYVRLSELELYGTPALSSLYRFPPRGLTADTDIVGGQLYGNGVYHVSRNSELIGFGAFRLFNDTLERYSSASTAYNDSTGLPNTTYTITDINNNSYSGVYIQLSLDTPFKLVTYELVAPEIYPERMAIEWVLLGSNDNIEWETIHYDFYSSWTINEIKRFSVNPTNYYSKYQIVFLRRDINAGTGYLQVGKLRFYGTPNPNDTYTFGLQYPPVALTTPLQTISGQRYGNGTYKVFGSSTDFNASSSVHNIFGRTSAGIWTTLPSLYTGGAVPAPLTSIKRYPQFDISGEYVQIELPTMVRVSTYRIRRELSQGSFVRTWRVYGSNTGTEWTMVDDRTTNTTDTSAPLQFSTFAVATPNYYRMYALVIQSIHAYNTSRARIEELELYGDPQMAELYRFPPRAIASSEITVLTTGINNTFNITGEAYGNGTYQVIASPGGFQSSYVIGPANLFVPFNASSTITTSFPSRSIANYNTATKTNFIQPDYTGEWVKFIFPQEILVNMITMVNYQANTDIRGYRIYGSNDDVNWTVLYTDSRSTYTQNINIDLNATRSYRYYALVVNKIGNDANAYYWLNDMTFYGTPSSSALIQTNSATQTLQLAPTADGKVVIGKSGVVNTRNEEVLTIEGNVALNGRSSLANKTDVAITTRNRVYQSVGGANSVGYTNTQGYYALARNVAPKVSKASAEQAVSKWVGRTAATEGTNQWWSVCWAAELGIFCSVGATGTNRGMISIDGINWRHNSISSNGWRSVCWSPELKLFCAVGDNGTNGVLTTSPDGINWTLRTVPSNLWWSVCWSAELGLFCAVAQSGSNRVMTSPDGINWTGRLSIGETNTWYEICWSPELGLFCAVAAFGGTAANRIMTSPDGINWTPQTAPSTNNWRSVCWAAELGLFCAIASAGSSRIMTSPNGINWTARVSTNESNQWRSVCWSAELGQFCAISTDGSNRVMTSPDGINWTGRFSSGEQTHTWWSICWSPELGIFCVVARAGTDRVMTTLPINSPPTALTVFRNPTIDMTIPTTSTELRFPPLAMTDNATSFQESQVTYGVGTYVAEGSSTDPSFPANKVFDRLTGTNDAWISASGMFTTPTALNGELVELSTAGSNVQLASETLSGPWLSITFPQKVGITRSVLTSRNSGFRGDPSTWYTYGRNDNGIWREVNSVTDDISGNANTVIANTTFTSPNVGYYNQYAVVIRKIYSFTGSATAVTYVSIGEWELYGTPDTVPAVRVRENNLELVPSGRGNVGIGKANPTQALDVSGSIVATGTITPFTGSHRVSATLSEFDVGKLVSSIGNIPTIEINNAWPNVQLSHTENDPSVFGVITKSSATYNLVNSVGEGSLWVTDKNGPISTGDLLTSSSVLGYGQKQSDDVVHNYTACRALMACAFSDTETKPVLQYKTHSVTKTREVPVLDASGVPIVDVVSDLDASGNTVMEEVPVLDADGNPTVRVVPVLDEAGNQLYDEVQKRDAETDELVFEEVQDVDVDGLPRVQQVPRVDADGVPVTEFVVVGEADEAIAVYDAQGQPVMEEVQARDAETGALLFTTVPTVDAAGQPVMEEVQATDPETGALLFNVVPKVDAEGAPVMKQVQKRDAETGQLVFETVLNVDANGVTVQEEYHTTDPDTGALLYTTTQVIGEDGAPLMQKESQLGDDGQPVYVSVQAKDSQGQLLYATEEARDPETGELVYEPAPLLDSRGNPVVVDGVPVYTMQMKMLQTPVMVDEMVMVDVPVMQQLPVMGMRDMYVTRAVMEEVQDEDRIPVMTTRQATHEEPVMTTQQKKVRLPVYEERMVYDEVPVMRQVPVMEQVARTITEAVKELREKMISKPRMTTEEYEVVEEVLNEDGKHVWEVKKDEAGNEVRIPAYEMRYVDANGVEITKAEYDSKKSAGQVAHKCAFIGCVYMCG